MAYAAPPDLELEPVALLKVLTAFRKGDFQTRMPIERTGLGGKIADTLNEILELQSTLVAEFRRVAGAVGKEGRINQRVEVPGALGGWAVMTGSMNGLVGDLVQPLTEMARVIGAVARGDLTQSAATELDGRPLKGEFLRTAKVVNGMVEQLGNFASEVTRVAREVGTDGKLGGQAVVKDGAGTWKDLTDNVNSMASNLTSQVRNIAEVTTAVANGDLSKKITVDVRGEFLKLKDTVNTMVDQLRGFASEVTRVAREVGTDGKLGGQALVLGVGGTWKDLTDSVNSMASNLTSQVRNIAEVTTAVATGNLGRKITVGAKGEILDLKNTINTMVDQLSSFASEVTRVAREVGTEGKLGGQAEVQGVAGVWAGLTNNVNLMASNLTSQVRGIAEVTTAVANGDLGKQITVDVQGEILQLKNTINTMVGQLGSFASEVTRVAREVGTEGRLGGQAVVQGVGGVWADLTESVNHMANNLTTQVRNIAEVTTAVANGNLNKKITVDVQGEILELKRTINTMVDQLSAFASEVTRVAREVGTEGKLGGQAMVGGVAGTWQDLTDNVNAMAGNLTVQLRDVSKVATAIAGGDLSKKVTVAVKGEILQIKETINTMVDQLNAFAGEVTRVAREVGTDGKLGGQAAVRGSAGTWKDLTDNVNFMASNLTAQVRNIAEVATAIAAGDLSKKIMVEARGEILELKNTINTMVDQLNAFAGEVTRVAREVGTEGKLGGQAHVPGAAGLWRDLTDNVNQLAGNLTSQVRAIAEVATAVTDGNLSRSVTVQAAGEVAALKDNINEMIRNLRETTNRNREQDWLKTNLAKVTRMLQGQRDLIEVANQILSEVVPLVSAQHGVFYLADGESEGKVFKLTGSYAYRARKQHLGQARLGEGLVGQAALERHRILVTEVPPDYVEIESGLGRAAPMNLVVLPVMFEGQVKAVLELASFNRFSAVHLAFLEQLTESIGLVLNTISATMRKEELLKQSQALTEELQSQQEELTETNKRLKAQASTLQQSQSQLKLQQEELQRANEELEQRARLLSGQKAEVEGARAALQDKAEQLALTSKYKSEFLANMSHELRTPLNSLLILSQILEENGQENLTRRQVEYAASIRSAGNDLLELINDVLDLSKIESGTMAVDLQDVPFWEILQFAQRTFQPVAEGKGLAFPVSLDAALPRTLRTDPRRLQQVIRNLLSNACKFTDRGSVELSISLARDGWSQGLESLDRAPGVVAFSVADTGIGIDPAKHRTVFEAFQQADGTTSRKYGGTGLGLSISREIARRFGGEIVLDSRPGAGSRFTLYLPICQPDRTQPAVEGPAREEPPARPLPVDPGPRLEDDQDQVATQDRVVLAVEDDPDFGKILVDLAREQGFKVVVAASAEQALTLARKYGPCAVTLDLGLPGENGWTVLDRLKHQPGLRHIPVHIISVGEDRRRGLRMGARSFLHKPASKAALEATFAEIRAFAGRATRRLLLVQPDPPAAVQELQALPGLETVLARTGAEALAALQGGPVDGLVLDLALPDMPGLELLRRIQETAAGPVPPAVLHPRRELAAGDPADLARLAGTLGLQAAASPERLLATATRMLHWPEAQLPPAQRRMVEQDQRQDPALAGRQVLVVDDDVRNLFALTAVLEGQRIRVVTAESGRSALAALDRHPDLDLVFMDLMLPEMDGYQTMRAIRAMDRFRGLPLIALTAKAMQGDREKSMAAGASGYITKPVDPDQILSVVRLRLEREAPEWPAW